jgi:hypothetical protein
MASRCAVKKFENSFLRTAEGAWHNIKYLNTAQSYVPVPATLRLKNAK